MRNKPYIGCAVAGLCSGAVTGLFGAGGGMVLVPLLIILTDLDENSIFPSSVAIIFPIALTALLLGSPKIPLADAVPYLIGSTAGGVLSGILGRRIPTLWLHRILGLMILWGGVRYLC